MNRKNVWLSYDKKRLTEMEKFSAAYKEFLDASKTEREAVECIVNAAEKNGYKELDALIRGGKKLKAGDKVYAVWMEKTVALFTIGKEPLEGGMNILGAHIDSPRLDVKQNPLYEDGDLALLDTHYYGGIKKYQYVALPLALHGVVAKKDGTSAIINIGEAEDDPVFFISDLLPHLSQAQQAKKLGDAIEGEALDLIVGHKPFIVENDSDKAKPAKASMSAGEKRTWNDEQAEKVEKRKLNGAIKRGVLSILYDLYEIAEDDFLSAELEIVPAGKAKDAGFDRAMILAYGHDDRVCAYPSMEALFQVKNPKRTACCILVDKEEIGSVGATGMESRFFENTVAEILALMGTDSNLALRRCLANSCMLSSDVSAGFDPTYASAFEKKNAALMGHGMVFNKFTGARGKSGSNDANAEYIAHLREIFDKEGVIFQTAELGKVDLGGGGTIAYILALYGMNVIDSGIAVLNMHAPWEAISKADLYETYRGYVAFLEQADFKNADYTK